MCLTACERNEPEIASGTFSISPTRKVKFAPGNLQYQASTDTWRFAEHQYDIIGAENNNISSTYSGWIDLFGWGTGNNPTNVSTSESDYSRFVDWGKNKIGTYAANTWRTLSRDEWVYIIKDRKNSSSLLGYGTIKGIRCGLIILPDNWTTPEGLTFNPGYNVQKVNSRYNNNPNEDTNSRIGGRLGLVSNKSCFGNNTYTATEWKEMEASGAIFLPLTGGRHGTDMVLEGGGFYWFSKPRGIEYILYLGDNHVGVRPGGADRSYGMAVRLARNAR